MYIFNVIKQWPKKNNHRNALNQILYFNIEIFFKEIPAWSSYSLAIILAALFVIYLFPLTFLQGNGRYFDGGDALQHISGWFYYVHDKWYFPLGYMRNLDYPEGANVALTDSIPLAAVFFKLLRPWLPEGFHYFGWWHLFVRFLQAVAATFLIRSLGYKKFLATVTAVIFALLTPAFNSRFGHTSLTTHALILFGFCIYVLGITKQWSLARSASAFIFLSIAALLIHPYLFGMVYPVFLAFLIDFGVKNQVIKPCIRFFVLSILLIVCTCFVFGYFSMGAGGAWGYGFFSMNMISPFLRSMHPAWLILNSPQDNYEGYNYFGLGLILILIFVVINQWNWLRQLPKRFPALTVLMVLFWLFALSNVVYFGKYKVLEFHLPYYLGKLAAIYPSGARMFWPIGYAFMFVGIVGVLRFKRSRMMVSTLLIIALLLQWFDTQKILNVLKVQSSLASTVNTKIWDPLINSVAAIDIFPLYSQKKKKHTVVGYEFFIKLGETKPLAINAARLAHYSQVPAEKQHFFDNPLVTKHLYIVLPELLKSPVPRTFQELLSKGQCREFTLEKNETGIACVVGSSPEWWHEKAPWMKSVSQNSLDRMSCRNAPNCV